MIVRSAFIYGHNVTASTNTLYFDELLGEGVQTITLDAKGWSMELLRAKVQEQLNNNGQLTYSVTVDRSTRLFTITASGTFSMLPSQDSLGTLSEVLGFTSDSTGSNSYTSDVPTGAVYYPQFPLEDYTPFREDQRPVQAGKTESPDGSIKGTNFGKKGYMTCSFKFIGDIEHRKDSPVESNPNGIQDAINFMDYATNFGQIDFFYDRNNLNDFTSCVQISNGRNKEGQGFALQQIRNLPKFRELKNIIFREV